MRNLTNQLVEVVRWYELGVALGIPAHKLDSTDQNYRGDSNRCKMGMLDIWLRTDLNASWEKLADALVAQGYDKVADKVRVECLGLPSGIAAFRALSSLAPRLYCPAFFTHSKLTAYFTTGMCEKAGQ